MEWTRQTDNLLSSHIIFFSLYMTIDKYLIQEIIWLIFYGATAIYAFEYKILYIVCHFISHIRKNHMINALFCLGEKEKKREREKREIEQFL